MRNLDIVNMKNSIKGRKSKILKLFLCFLLLGVSYSFANNNNYSQLKTLSVNVNNKTLREVFQTIEKTRLCTYIPQNNCNARYRESE
jgi:hypothetical protein